MDLKFKPKKILKKSVEPESSNSSDDDEDQAALTESDASQDDNVSNPVKNELQKELNKMSFEDIQKLQNKLGLKKYWVSSQKCSSFAFNNLSKQFQVQRRCK